MFIEIGAGLVRWVLASWVMCVALISVGDGVLGQDHRAVEYGLPKKLAKLTDERINEASGMARCLARPGTFWVHNDSGGQPRLFLIDQTGKTLGVVKLKGASCVDWEDLCSFEIAGEKMLLVGDIGDNLRRRKTCTLYLMREPRLTPNLPAEVSVLRTIEFTYDDGPHDCEAIAVDPQRQEILLITKSVTEAVRAYTLPLKPQGRGRLQAKSLRQLTLPSVSGMDISPDGQRLVVLQYVTASEIKRRQDETWTAALRRAPRVIRLPPQRQCESICFGHDGRSLFSVSEGYFQPLWKIPVAASTSE